MKHAVFGQVVEGLDVLEGFNSVLVDHDKRPFRDIMYLYLTPRIKHTIILDDPFPDPKGLIEPSRSPSPSEFLSSSKLRFDEDFELDDESKKIENEMKAQALTLEMIGDIPFAEVRPPENVLFVCKLNPVTRDEDLELIFSRFGTIMSCEIVRDKENGKSLGYAFIEYSDQKSAEEAFLKMNNVLIDDKRIHVDFSQSVAKMKGFKRERESEYGKGLEKRRMYRNEVARETLDLVFDHNNKLRLEK